MSREETAGSVEMAFGVWGAVGPSSLVLDGGPGPPMVRGNFGGASSPIEKHLDCVFPSVQRHVSPNRERCTPSMTRCMMNTWVHAMPMLFNGE